MILINNKEYRIRKPNEDERAYWDHVWRLELTKLFSPIKVFLESIKSLPEDLQRAALQGFVASRQNTEYPFYYQLLAQNTLESARLLVQMTTDCPPEEVTELNKRDVLEQIFLFWYDPELLKIREIRRKGHGTSSAGST